MDAQRPCEAQQRHGENESPKHSEVRVRLWRWTLRGLGWRAALNKVVGRGSAVTPLLAQECFLSFNHVLVVGAGEVGACWKVVAHRPGTQGAGARRARLQNSHRIDRRDAERVRVSQESMEEVLRRVSI